MTKTVGMILAAGFGTRLGPLREDKPKPLMELLAKPLIVHQIYMLEEAQVFEIYINLHYHAEKIISEIAKWPIKAKIYFSKEKEILGTAGGLRQVLQLFDIKNKNMILLHGDMVADLKLEQTIDQKSFLELVCAKNYQAEGYKGGVSINKQRQVLALGRFFESEIEAQENGFFTGIHFLSKQALSLVADSKASCLVSELYPQWLLEKKPVKAVMKSFYYQDLGTPERLLKANIDFIENMGRLENSIYLSHLEKYSGAKNIYLGSNCRIFPGVKLKGPLIIGSNSTVESGAELGPKLIVGNNCTIKIDTKLANSLILSDTVIEKSENLDCVIAQGRARVLIGD